ncbi:hypothetical protein YB2330_002325 [Saitoella coloradoensis]
MVKEASAPVATFTKKRQSGTVQGMLFTKDDGEPLIFWLSHKVPSKVWYRERIEANGGKITNWQKEAGAIQIGDHLKDNGTDLVSYKFIDDSLSDGILRDVDDYVLTASAPEKAKGTRTPFTKEDDAILRKYVHKSNVSRQGNKVYKELEKKFPHHTFQSWRHRYVKTLEPLWGEPEEEMDEYEMSPDEEDVEEHAPRRVSAPVPPTSTERPPSSSSSRRQTAIGVTVPKKVIPFSVADDNLLAEWVRNHPKGHLISGNKIYQELYALHPHHPWQSWRSRWLRRVGPQLRASQEAEVEEDHELERTQRTQTRQVKGASEGRRQTLPPPSSERLTAEVMAKQRRKTTGASPAEDSVPVEKYDAEEDLYDEAPEPLPQEDDLPAASSPPPAQPQPQARPRLVEDRSEDNPFIDDGSYKENQGGELLFVNVDENEDEDEDDEMMAAKLDLVEDIAAPPQIAGHKRRRTASPELPMGESSPISERNPEQDPPRKKAKLGAGKRGPLEIPSTPDHPTLTTPLKDPGSPSHRAEKHTHAVAEPHLPVVMEDPEEAVEAATAAEPEFAIAPRPDVAAKLEQFIVNSIQKYKVTRDQAVYALGRTSGNRSLAHKVVQALARGRKLPNISGVWTEEEDKLVVSSKERTVLEALDKKHNGGLSRRSAFLDLEMRRRAMGL